ncbi:MAG: hypothetical protein Q7K21_00255, partial [Elusimicrobiota bacterium]|nr:hypothetical protein [Elusimicrobiota bacterium]
YSSSRPLRVGYLVFIFLFSASNCLHSAGIATTFVNINLDNLLLDTTYNLRVSYNYPLKVINRSPDPREIAITAKIPQKDNPKENYEPIPDLNWVTVIPERYQLGPNETGSSDVILVIPKNKKLRGKKFRIDLEICGYPVKEKGGMKIVPSLLTKLRFSIYKKKKSFFGLW